MPVLQKVLTLGFVAALGFGVAACAPEVGSPEWCEQMKEKPKGEWTANEMGDFTKNCLM